VVLEHEWVDGCHLDPGAGRAHVLKVGFEVLERRQVRALRARRLAAQPLPEASTIFGVARTISTGGRLMK
jgi:hypothetical protein